MTQSPTQQTATGGGAHIGQSVSSGRDFIARDGYTIHGPATIYQGNTAPLPPPTPPAPPTIFGRAQFITTIVAQLAQQPALALHAIGGMGKTALALNLGHEPRLVAAFPAGRIWVELGPNPDLLSVLARVLALFGQGSDGLLDVASRADRLRSLLADQAVLLLLDDVWTPAHAQPFLPACPASGRSLLTLRRSQVADDLGVPSLPLPALEPAPARQLLAAAGPPAQRAVNADEKGADALCAYLGHLPLVLHVVGRQLNRLARSDGPGGALATLRQQVAEARQLLTLRAAHQRLGVADLEPTLAAVLALSYDHLPDDASRRALDQLAVFGPQPLHFSKAAMAAVWGGVDEATAQAWRLALVEAGLLESSGNEPRYSLHQMIQHFAAAYLSTDAAAEKAARLAHATFYATIVADWDQAIAEARMTYQTPLEWENVAVALAWLSQQVDDDQAAQALLAYTWHWRNVLFNKHDRQRVDWLAAAMTAARRIGNERALANVLQAQGEVYNFLKRTDEALAVYGEALTLYRAVGDRLGEANVLKAQGEVYNFLKRTDEALAVYGEALTLYRAVGARLGEANVLLVLGDLCRADERYGEAWVYYSDVQRLYAAIGDRYSLARVLYRMGDWHAAQTHKAEAAALYQQAIALWQAIDLADLAAQIITPRLQALTAPTDAGQ